MHNPSWRLQDAKAQFSALVDAALNGEAQLVTRRGKRAVVVLAASEYERLQQGERAKAPGFIDHLLAVPRATGRPRCADARRPALSLRDVVLD